MRDDYTEIAVVLDRSGSMEAVREDTIGGFNSFLEEQKKLPGMAKLTLMQFDTEFETVHDGKALAEVPPLDRSTFVPRGMTALLDAIGQTINTTGKRLSDLAESERPGKVIVVILTDGMENSSREFTRDKINEMISRQRDTYKWEFVFLGANQDAIQTGASLGVAAANSMSYAANSKGTRAAFTSMSASIGNYRGGGSAAFTEQDRDEQSKAGA